MEKQAVKMQGRSLAALGILAVLVWLFRGVLLALGTQLLGGYALTALALPGCRWLEKRLSPGLSAALALLMVATAGLALLLGLIPPLAQQLGQLAAKLPQLLAGMDGWLGRAQAVMEARGVSLSGVQQELAEMISGRAGAIVTAAAGMASQLIGWLGKLALAPLIAFYLLRDRRQIAALAVLVFPVRWRARAVRAAREMRREAVGFFRGQMLLCAAVAGMTALGLMLVGTPGWLVLGLLMGVMELVPYAGPVAAGIPAVLLGLQGGVGQAALTLLVLVAVQQLEGSVLSPRLLSGATRLHPLAVLLCVSAGGIFAGAWGMLLALPAVVSLRGALRGLR